MTELELLKQNVFNKNLVNHCIAVQAIMESLAEHFGEDQKKWGVSGLLHDIDYEQTKDDPHQHTLVGFKMLKDLGYDDDICQAVKTHNEIHGSEPQTLMAKALFCADPISGLIVASALVLPSKKLADVKPENIVNRFHEKSFAKGANRAIIAKCGLYLGLTLEKFADICLRSMQKVSVEINL